MALSKGKILQAVSGFKDCGKGLAADIAKEPKLEGHASRPAIGEPIMPISSLADL
jgi:hypothetical protein